MATIGFVTYEDFRNEVRDAGVTEVNECPRKIS